MGPSFPGKILAYIAALIAAGVVCYSAWSSVANADWQKVFFAAWAVGVPLWFLFEYWKLAPSDPEERAEFRHYQELARHVWFGFGAVMMVVLFGRP